MSSLVIPCTGPEIELFDFAGAAEYTGLTASSIKYHVYTVGDLEFHKLGNSVLFTRTQLDAFKAAKREVGRPHKESILEWKARQDAQKEE